ncbi:Protein TONNEAU 1a [Asimina triloba]
MRRLVFGERNRLEGFFDAEQKGEGRAREAEMDDYTREMMDLKTLVTRTLEKKGVLAKIRAELRASVFEAIEEEDRAIVSEDGGLPALLGSCNDHARQLHASPSGIAINVPGMKLLYKMGRLLTALQKDFWKAELRDFLGKNGYDISRNSDSGPLLLDVLEGYLKFESLSQTTGAARRMTTSETESLSSVDARNVRRPSSSSSSLSAAGGLPPLGRAVPVSQASDRRTGSSVAGFRKDEYNWRYDNDDLSEDMIRASTALENIQLDRKARNLTTSWRYVQPNVPDDGISHADQLWKVMLLINDNCHWARTTTTTSKGPSSATDYTYRKQALRIVLNAGTLEMEVQMMMARLIIANHNSALFVVVILIGKYVVMALQAQETFVTFPKIGLHRPEPVGFPKRQLPLGFLFLKEKPTERSIPQLACSTVKILISCSCC